MIFSTLIRTLVPAIAAFGIGMVIAPILARFLYACKAWKKKPGKNGLDGRAAEVFNDLHKEHEVRAPRMGGVVIWGSVIIVALVLKVLAHLFDHTFTILDFTSRNQTWIPLAALVIGSLVGLLDDILVVRSRPLAFLRAWGVNGEGLRLRVRLLFVIGLSSFIGWWFYAKLAVVAVSIPFATPFVIGWLIIPLFVLVSLALYASGVVDGIDGLSGGVFASIFASYTIIAFAQDQINLAAFCASIVGSLLAFLWFNIPPARFYMSDTGTMGLTLALAVVAFMTDNLGGGIGIAALPIIGGILVVTVASNIVQIFWKKVFGRKLLRVAPLHHHFEAIGWPGHKVTMRYWIVSVMLAFVGVIFALAAL